MALSGGGYHTPFTEEDTEAQRDEVWSQSLDVAQGASGGAFGARTNVLLMI